MCEESGIISHNTLKQNGVAEMINRTLLDKVRCMILSSGAQKSFWGETIMTICLINLTRSITLNDDTHEKRYDKLNYWLFCL